MRVPPINERSWLWITKLLNVDHCTEGSNAVTLLINWNTRLPYLLSAATTFAPNFFRISLSAFKFLKKTNLQHYQIFYTIQILNKYLGSKREGDNEQRTRTWKYTRGLNRTVNFTAPHDRNQPEVIEIGRMAKNTEEQQTSEQTRKVLDLDFELNNQHLTLLPCVHV